jgi:squalene synthase HpnC
MSTMTLTPDDAGAPSVADLASGKGAGDENFPVASVLIAPRHRPAVMAFYDFARAADDVADNPDAAPDQKLDILEEMRATLAGERDVNAKALALRDVQAARGLSPQHGLDLLEAFRRDVTKLRYADWGELMDYCRYSAAPVGRFVLDVHGESRATWPANDALCTALQVINHLQDCAKDYRDLNRVYLPDTELAAAGVDLEALGAKTASPALRHVLADLAGLTGVLLDQARPLSGQVRDGRLALEIAVIQRLAESLNRGLRRRDPLSQPVHHSKPQVLGLALTTAMAFPFKRFSSPRLAGRRTT